MTSDGTQTSEGTDQTNSIAGDEKDYSPEVTSEATSPQAAQSPDTADGPEAMASPQTVQPTDAAESEDPEFQQAAPAGPVVAPTGTSGAATGIIGGIAVVSAGLGLSSLIGNPLSDMLREREGLVGQIEAGSGGGGDQIEALYSAPWNTAALVNGIIALVAVVIGAVVLVVAARRSDGRAWVTAAAVGGVVLGLVGFVLAGGMYLDLFASPPEMPTTPQMVPGG